MKRRENPGNRWSHFPDCAALHPGYQRNDYPGFLAVTIHELESITTPFGRRNLANSFFRAVATTSC
jgi:hypothetical protein